MDSSKQEFGFSLKNKINILEVINSPEPKLDFVIDGLLAGTVGSIIAPGATGKSYFALSLLSDLTTGNDSLGLGIQETQQKCIYLTIEDPVEVLKHRIHNLGKHLDSAAREKIAARLHIESQSGSILHLVDHAGDYDMVLVEQMCEAFAGTRLVILDTLRRFHGGNENDSGHMSTLISTFEYIAKRSGAAILFLHHTNKTSTMNGSGLDQSASRGSGSLTDNIRCQINLSIMPQKIADKYKLSDKERRRFVQVATPKANYQENNGVHWLKRVDGGILKKHTFDKQPMPRGKRDRR